MIRILLKETTGQHLDVAAEKERIIKFVEKVVKGESPASIKHEVSIFYDIIVNDSYGKIVFGAHKKFGLPEGAADAWKKYFSSKPPRLSEKTDFYTDGVWTQYNVNAKTFPKNIEKGRTYNFYVTIKRDKENIEAFINNFERFGLSMETLSDHLKTPLAYKTHSLLDSFSMHNDSLKVYFYDAAHADVIARNVKHFVTQLGMELMPRTHEIGVDKRATQEDTWEKGTGSFGYIAASMIADQFQAAIQSTAKPGGGNSHTPEQWFAWLETHFASMLGRIKPTLRESREQQIRRELDNVVNGTDYGASVEQADDDPTVARAKGLEIDDDPIVQPKKREYLQYYANGQKMIKQYFLNDGILVRKNYYDSGKKQSETYHLDMEYHRADGPAYVSWYRNGKKSTEQYFFRGRNHRVDGPAYSSWDDEGRKTSENYMINGKPHRTDGPASLGWDESGEIVDQRYYLNGTSYPREKWQEIVKKIHRDYLDLNDQTKSEYKFTKNRKSPSDPRFAGLDLADNQPPQKTDDKEFGNRAKGLEVEPPKKIDAYSFSKNRKPSADPRFKGLELDEMRKSLKETFTKLLKRPF